MIKISSVARESLTMPKPKSLKTLAEKICLVYEIKVFQLVLLFENDSGEHNLLKSEDDYKAIIDNERDFTMIAYIEPASQKWRIIPIVLGSIVFTYLLMKYATIKSLSVSISDNSGYLLYLFIDIGYALIFIVKTLLHGSYWIPLMASFGHLMKLIKAWMLECYRKKALHKNKITYSVIFLMNYVPGVIGYGASMIVVIWLVLAYFHVLLHRPKPRNPKDKRFLRVVGFVACAAIPRLIYNY